VIVQWCLSRLRCGVGLLMLPVLLIGCGGGADPTAVPPTGAALRDVPIAPATSVSTVRAVVSPTGQAATPTRQANTPTRQAATPSVGNTPPPAATAVRTPVGTPRASVTRAASASAVATPRRYAAAPPLTIDPAKTYSAVLVTSLGTITVALNARDAPRTVNNFVFLAREGFYDNTIFHRVLPGFVIQGGDPTGTGQGGPGYQFPDEPVKGKYEVGSVAMANSGRNTNGSQFFICDGQGCTALPTQYNLFGKVTTGIEVVHAIAAVPTTASGTGERSRPLQTVLLLSVRIEEK